MGVGVAHLEGRVPDLDGKTVHGPKDLSRKVSGKKAKEAATVDMLLVPEILLARWKRVMKHRDRSETSHPVLRRAILQDLYKSHLWPVKILF
jgi:hypothetical protein